MSQSTHRPLTLSLSALSVIAFGYFLLSPVMLLPADPAYAQLTTGKTAIVLDGESWVPIHGLQLVFQLTGLISVLAFVLVSATTLLQLGLSPFITYINRKTALTVIAGASTINLIALAALSSLFSSHIETYAFSAGVISTLLVIAAISIKMKSHYSNSTPILQ